MSVVLDGLSRSSPQVVFLTAKRIRDATAFRYSLDDLGFQWCEPSWPSLLLSLRSILYKVTKMVLLLVLVASFAHPQTVQSFSGVTSILPDDARGLIYVANGEGIWILSHQQVLRRHYCSSSDAISAGIPNCD